MKLLEHWLPPDGAGDPVGCIASTFTFDAEFFAADCLARFLGLSGAYGEGDRAADVALMIEEEERLGEARVVVLADRNCRPGPRNLRWDLLLMTVPGALLHAKTAVLVWQRALRVIIGSANLTAAGYRRQLEAAVAFDVDDHDSAVPRDFLDGLIIELRDMVDRHAFGDAGGGGPKQRAQELLTVIAARAELLPPKQSRRDGLRIALAPSKTGTNPLRSRAKIWRGSSPRRLLALSPFWDDDQSSMPGARAVLGELSQRSADGKRPRATFVVAVDPLPGGNIVRAPMKLSTVAPDWIASDVRALAKEAGDSRRLHAKAVVLEGDGCVAAMIGSSNLTAKGLGLDARSHREINVWFSALPRTPEADLLRKLVRYGDPVETDWPWDSGLDEDEPHQEPLPEGFADALLTAGDDGLSLQLTFKPQKLPSVWSVSTPAGRLVIDGAGWVASGRPTTFNTPILEPYPSSLDVTWTSLAGTVNALWPVNVSDLTLLPPPIELRDLPVSVLLNVLASTRPLRVALEAELRMQSAPDPAHTDELDPLRRFDTSGLLLHRVRRASAALWGLQQRLARPLASLDALDWRLNSTIGPVKIADGLVADANRGLLTVPEATFLLAELALTISAVDWDTVGERLDRHEVRSRVKGVLATMAIRAKSFESDVSEQTLDGLALYLRQAFKRAGVE